MNKSHDSRADILKKLERFSDTTPQDRTNDLDTDVFAFSDLSDYDLFLEKFQNLGGVLFKVNYIHEIPSHLKTLMQEKKIKTWVSNEYQFFNEISGIPVLTSEQVDDYSKIQASITSCEALIARHGSILVSSKSDSGRRLHIIPDIHIVIAYQKQIVKGIKDALNKLENRYKHEFPSFFSIISGPSRTADIEKTLIMGAHGPKEILLFLVHKE